MSMPRFVYLDNNATTRVAPEVVEAMLPFLTEHWANPSSGYACAQHAAKAIADARSKAAALIHADPREIIFTSGGTESNHAAIRSALAQDPARRHVVMTSVEHSSNLRHGEALARAGHEVTFLPVNGEGALDLRDVAEAIRPETAIVSVMWANNETGVLFPVEQIAAICREKGVLFHTDAVQMAGKLPIDVRITGVDFLSLSAHKLHAPKGIGLLYVRRGAGFQPLLWGGQQERGRRGGTENVPSIAGFGRAAEIALERLSIAEGAVRAVRDRLEAGILETIPGTRRNGAKEPRLPNTTNIAFEGLEAEALLILLDQAGVCASSGSACQTGALEPSHVLRAMGLSPGLARGSIRFSAGADTTPEDVSCVLARLPGLVERLRS